MNVVDSSGWLEYFADGPNAAFFAPAILKSKDLLVSTINLFEVFKRVSAQRGEAAALEAISLMQKGHAVIAVDAAIYLRASELSQQLKLPMADSLILATAHQFRATLWTQDADFEHIEGVKFVKK
jgi:toxin FitB